jgi:hypothetical protein
MPAGTPFTGKDITFKSGSPLATAVSVAGWQINIEGNNSQYATNDTAGWTKTLVGVKTWSGTLTVLLHDGEAQPFKVGDSPACEFIVATGASINGTIIVTAVNNIGTSVDSADPIAVEYAFNGQGAPTETGTVFLV